MHRLIRHVVPMSLLVAFALVAAPQSQAAPNRPEHARGVALNHLKDHAAAYGLRGDLSDLQGQAVIASPGGFHVRFQQTVQGIPVDDSIINVGVDASDAVQLVVSGYAGTLNKIDTTARVDQGRAIASARAAVGRADAELNDATLVVYAAGTPALAWKVVLSAEEPGGAWNVFVSAVDGRILGSRDLLQLDTGRGKIFNPNPVVTLQNTTLTDQNNANYAALAGAYTTVDLLGLDGSGYLRGPYANATGKRAAVSSTLQFLYTRDNVNFEQVMAYYHIDRVQRAIQALGFTNVNNRQQAASANTSTADNSFYSPTKKSITLGSGGVDDGEDADVIVHEYGHAIQDNQVPGFGSSAEGGAMGEGFGDYLAFSMNSAGQTGAYVACIAEWDSVSYASGSPACLRRVDGSKVYPRDIQNEVHADGEIWSRALFDIWNSLGKTVSDRVILQSHFYLTPTAKFTDGANAILAADQALYAGQHAAQLRSIFATRGIPTN